jgi:hypothetical protein
MGKKKLKIYQEDAKLRQTTHWDLDYMTTVEIDALYGIRRSQKTQDLASSKNGTGIHDRDVRKTDTQPSWQRPQRSPGKALIWCCKNLVDLFRHKKRVYSINR